MFKHQSFVLIVALLIAPVIMSAQEKANGENGVEAKAGLFISQAAVVHGSDIPNQQTKVDEKVTYKALSTADSVPEQQSTLPLWYKLDQMRQLEKQNIRISLEGVSTQSAQLLDIERWWNETGEYQKAIDAIHGLNDEGIILAAGMQYKTSPAASKLRFLNNDPGIITSTSYAIEDTHLDYHAGSGNLFAVTQTTHNWYVSISTDKGKTWTQTHEFFNSLATNDVSARVQGNYLYVAYVTSDSPDEARLRRFNTADGSVDSAYFYHVVFDKNIDIEEIALESNADGFNTELYYSAVLNDGNLTYYFGDPDGSFSEIVTDVTGVSGSLDIHFNADYSDNSYIWASYIKSDGSLAVWHRRPPNNYETILKSSGATKPRISAYGDNIIVVYQYGSPSYIGYDISYDTGSSWNFGDFYSDNSNYLFSPDVTARGGRGTAIIYQEESGEPDAVHFKFRSGYESGAWDDIEKDAFNAQDVSTGSPTTIEWLSETGYGMSYKNFMLQDSSYTNYFDGVNLHDGINPSIIMYMLN